MDLAGALAAVHDMFAACRSQEEPEKLSLIHI